MNKNMKKHLTKKLFIMLPVIALIAGCGGGAGGGATTAPTNTLASETVTDPLTGKVVPGTPTKNISGITYNNATVTAYSVQPDGSNGPALGPSTVANFAGEFSMVLSKAPTGMVRLIATGGSYSPMNIDNTLQQNISMELVTPYVATSLSYFKISPLTHIASHAMSFRAKNGATLVEAFKAGMMSALELDIANAQLWADTTVYINLLKDSITSDKQAYSSESLNAIEWFGVQYDLPSSVVVRVLAASAETDYPRSGVDGSGQAINVGKWVNGVFDEAAPLSLDTMMTLNTPDAINVIDPKTGGSVRPGVADFISRNLIMDFDIDKSCPGYGDILNRYPYYHLEDTGGQFLRIPVADCTASAQRIANLKARITTNNRTKMK